jgi:hypothetical protein
MAELNEDGLAVELGPGVVIRTPGLRGQVTLHEPASPGSRSAEQASAALLEAMARAEMAEDVTVEITEQREVEESSGSRAAGGEDDIVLEVRDPGESFGQAVLYEAEDGTLSWHFPAGAVPADGSGAGPSRGTGTLTYRIPREVVRADETGAGEEAGQRGILGAAGKKILKVLVFRVVDEASQYVGDRLARRFEAKHRPHRLRSFTPEDYTDPAPDAGLDTVALQRFTEGPALLYVHGTSSTAHNGFGRIPRDAFAALHERYGGRVLALDHPTVSVSPTENVAWLAEELRRLGDRRLTVDVVAHSRGGLVSRLLTEHPDLTEGRLEVSRLVMVATPNAGTALASPKRVGQLLNRMTTLLQLVPSNGVTDVLDVILAVVKQVAIGAFKGLDGIMAMDPDGDFLRNLLNRPSDASARYFAAAADFEPLQGSPLLRVARDRGTDIVFGDSDNDLVVPTRGVFEVPGASSFPVVEPLVFEAADAVDHSSFWPRPQFTEKLLGWLAP